MRRLASVPLVVLAILLTAVGGLLRWADKTAFDTASVAADTAQVLDDPALQQYLTTKLTDRIVLDLLGDESKRALVEPLVRAQVEDPALQSSFIAAVRDSHRALVSGDTPTIEFNLRETANIVRARVIDALPEAQRKIPDPNEAFRFSLVDRGRLPAVWDFADRSHDVAILVLVLGAALIALALIIGPTRWTLLLAYGLGTAGLAIATVVIVRRSINGVATGLPDPSAKAAFAAVRRPFIDSLSAQCMVIGAAGLLCALVGAGLGVLGVGTSTRVSRSWSPPPSYRQNDWK